MRLLLLATAAVALGLVAGCGGGETTTVVVTTSPSTAPPTEAVRPTTASSVPTTLGPAPTATAPVETSPTDTVPVETAQQPRVQRPADFPTVAEARLLERVVSDYRPWCTRESEGNRTKSARAALFCDLRSLADVRVYHETFGSLREMENVYARYRRGSDVATATGNCARGRIPGEQTWFFNRSRNVVEGRLLCFRADDGLTWYIWTHDDLRAVSWAFGRNRAAVLRFWRGNGSLVE